MSGSSFDSIAEAERRAQRTLPKSVFVMLQAGNERGLTRAANVTAFDEIGWLPRIGDQPAAPRQSTTVLGREISLPVVISPTGTQAAHPQGEIAVARAAAARGTIMSLSAFGSKPIEDVVVANPHTLFQV